MFIGTGYGGDTIADTFLYGWAFVQCGLDGEGHDAQLEVLLKMLRWLESSNDASCLSALNSD